MAKDHHPAMMRVRVYQIGRWAIPFLCDEVVEAGLPYLGSFELTRDELHSWLALIEAEALAAIARAGD